MHQSDHGFAAILQAGDLSVLLDRLEGVHVLVAGGRVRQASDELALTKGLARAAELAASMVADTTQSAGDKAHYEALQGLANSAGHLMRGAYLKLSQCRADAAAADVEGAIKLAEQMVEAAERFAQVAP